MTISRTLAAFGVSAAVAVLGVVGLSGTASANLPDLTMTVTPSTIDAGQSTVISGENCIGLREVQQAVQVSVQDANENVVATARVIPDGNGSWSTDVTMTTAGAFTVFASCDTYVLNPLDYPSQPLTVNQARTSSANPPTSSGVAPSSTPPSSTPAHCTPTLTLVDYTGAIAQGETMGVDVTCYRPGEKLQVILHSDPIVLTTLIADSSGNASGAVTIPLDAPIGGHTITVVGELSGISLESPIAVVAAVETTATAPLTQQPTPTPVVTTTSLANTGVNAAAMTVWGVVLLVAGGIAVAMTRRRDGKHVRD